MYYNCVCLPFISPTQQLKHSPLQDSPNPKGVLGSKASGEPSLLLTTSILYALRNAVVSARDTLSAASNPSAVSHTFTPSLLESIPEPSNPATPILTPGASILEGQHPAETAEGRDIFVFAAPATTVRLKQACGVFSVAEVLKAALGSQGIAHAGSSGSESWVEVEGAVRV